ncbi:hypothetical protein ACJX0J_016274, partial [Zea mays]
KLQERLLAHQYWVTNKYNPYIFFNRAQDVLFLQRIFKFFNFFQTADNKLILPVFSFAQQKNSRGIIPSIIANASSFSQHFSSVAIISLLDLILEDLELGK